MAAFTLIDLDLLVGGLEMSAFANQASLSSTVAEVESMTFASGGWSQPIGGRRTTAITMAGPTDMATATAAQLAAVDEILTTTIGTAYPVSAIPLGSSDGAVGYFTNALLTNRVPLQGGPGDLATHSVTFSGNLPLVRGTVLSAATVTLSSSSAVQQLGAVSASQRIWAVVHVLTAGGTTPSITVKIQSAPTSGFAAPTDRITFTAATAKGAQFSSTVGAITDQYWRANFTVSGTSPSFQVRVLAGIQ